MYIPRIYHDVILLFQLKMWARVRNQMRIHSFMVCKKRKKEFSLLQIPTGILTSIGVYDSVSFFLLFLKKQERVLFCYVFCLLVFTRDWLFRKRVCFYVSAF